MDVKKSILLRVYVSFIVLCLMGLAILGQIFRIQFVEGEHWRQRQDSTSRKYVTIESARGNISSCDGNLMATSIPFYDLRMDTRSDFMTQELFDEKLDSLSHELADLFKDKTWLDYKRELRDARAAGNRYFLIRPDMTYSEMQAVKKMPLFRFGHYKGGLIVEQQNKRELLFDWLASRTIGTVRDVKPVGIEASFDNELKGVNGRRLMQKISGGWMPVTDNDEVEPRDGNDLVTTIDLNIQDVAEHSLRQHLIENNADHGCVVLMEVATGEVKAIANLSRMENGNYVEDFNYVIAEATEPGSTFKMASLLAAMDDGLVEPTDTVQVGNGITRYADREMKDSHAPHCSKLSVEQAFEASSNVGISRIIYQHYNKHEQKFIDKLKSFGLGEKLGLQIEGEGQPFIENTTDKTWSKISLPWISIGYESKLTPLQILTFYNAIANNGRMVRPRFVSEIQSHGKTLKHFPVEVIRDSIASPDALRKARMLMEGVVQNGTGSVLKSSPYKIAGKTGTAQIHHPKFGYDKSHLSYQASFVGYFPADRPRYSCMVVVYAPGENVYYGGAVAAPIFKDVADKVYANHIQLHEAPPVPDSAADIIPVAKAGHQQDLKKVFAGLRVPVQSGNPDAMWVSAQTGKDQVVINERKDRAERGVVPNVIGMGARDAVYLLENAGLSVRVNGRGQVIRQSLDAGMKIQKGQSIVVELD